MNKGVAVAILAAGKGTRMKRDDIPKVCNLVLGKPLIRYVVEQAESLAPEYIICIIGHQREKVIEVLEDKDVRFVVQAEQLGTGHAVQQCADVLRDFTGNLIVLSGDVPMLQGSTLQALLEKHQAGGFKATVLSALADDPSGYGRILRTAEDHFDRIVEHKDADESIRAINEINSGIYVFDSPTLFAILPRISNQNAQGEYYLPDALELIRRDGHDVGVEISETFSEIQGINTVDELKAVEIRMSAE